MQEKEQCPHCKSFINPATTFDESIYAEYSTFEILVKKAYPFLNDSDMKELHTEIKEFFGVNYPDRIRDNWDIVIKEYLRSYMHSGKKFKHGYYRTEK